MDSKLLDNNEAMKILKEIGENNDLSMLEEHIKDNIIDFKYGDKFFRVRMLNRAEKEELNTLRVRKFGELIQDKNILLEKDLRKIYKDRDVADLDELDEKIRKLESEKSSIQLKLGESISEKVGESALKVHKDKIELLKTEITILLIQKSNLLTFSLENQLMVYVSEYITYLSLDIKKDDEWERMFKSYTDFKQYKDDKLIEKAAYYSMLLEYRT